MQNAAIDLFNTARGTIGYIADKTSANGNILPVEKAWPESYLAIDEIIDKTGSLGMPFIDTIANLAIVSVILALFLFAFTRILEGIYAVSVAAFNSKMLLDIERQANLYTSRNILLVFSLIISVFIFLNYKVTRDLIDNDYALGIKFIVILLAVACYFLIRYILFKAMDWVNRKSVFKYLNRFYYTHAILGILLLLFGFIISIILPTIPQNHILFYIIGVFIITLLLYFIRGYQIIISNGFSHFFWILYLCTLEILPAIVILHLILS